MTIDLEDTVQYSSARIANPDRIFFDLHSARLTPEVARGNVQVKGDLLTGVRVAQNQAGVVRVVLDVTGVKDYAATLLSNPPQLVIYLYSTVRNGAASENGEIEERKAAERRGTSEDARASSDDSGNVKSVSEKTSSVDPGPSSSSAPSNAMTRSTGTSGKTSHAKQIGPLAGNAERQAGFDSSKRGAGTDARRAIHANTRAGLEDWTHCDRCWPWRA